jgi:hypothetical protein
MKKIMLMLVLAVVPAVSCFAEELSLPQGGPAAVAEARPPQKGAADRFLDLYIPQLFAAMAVLCLVSEGLLRKAPGCACAVKKSWNWGLLLAFLGCAALGFVLLFPLEKAMKGLAFRWHIWTGVFCVWAGGYHAIKRFRAMC